MCYVILSDIHANYTAVTAITEALDRIAAPKKFYFLGDLLGYGPPAQAVQCIDWLHYQSQIYGENGSEESRWVPGNHDEWAITQLGQMRDEGFVTVRAQQALLAASRAADWEWFANEVRAVLQDDETRSLLIKTRGAGPEGLFLAFTHGGVPLDLRRVTYLWPWQPSILRSHFAPLRERTDAGTKVLFTGHTHLPFLAQLLPDTEHTLKFHSIKYGRPIRLGPGEWIINPGSAGHPRDGDPRAAFAVFEPDARTVVFQRVEYDTRKVVTALQEEKYNKVESYDSIAGHLLTLELGNFQHHRQRLQQGLEQKPPKIDRPGQQTLWDLLETGRTVNPDRPGARLRREYSERIEQTYKHLIHEIEFGSGGEDEQRYHAEIYRVPQWDLEAVGA